MTIESASLDHLPQVVENAGDGTVLEFGGNEKHHGFLLLQSRKRVIPSSPDPDSCVVIPTVSLMFSVVDTYAMERLLKTKESQTVGWNKERQIAAARLEDEINRHDDVVVVEMVDVYRGLPYKLLLCHQWLFDHYNTRFVMKTDDDVYANVTNILNGLKRVDSRQSLWWGNFRSNWPAEHHGKWREDKYTADVYPDFACGSGNVISAPVHQLLVHNRHSFQLFQGEDVSMGIWLSAFNVTYIRDPRWLCDGRCSQDWMTLPQLQVDDLHRYWNNTLMCSNP